MGLWLNPLNWRGKLEFSIKESIFVLDLEDVSKFIKSDRQYLGNPAHNLQPGSPAHAADPKPFLFVNVQFYKLKYDAVRFRVKGGGGQIASDDHIVGNWIEGKL